MYTELIFIILYGSHMQICYMPLTDKDEIFLSVKLKLKSKIMTTS